ncbi:MAG TPA: AAA family ATPase [Capillimicrobium sp.]
MSGRGDILVERDAELAQLERATARALSESGGLAVVEGPAGIGKSRLLAAHRASARGAGATVLLARGGELEAEVPYAIVRQLFERTLAARADELLVGAARAAAPIFGDDETPSTPAADPGARVVHGLYWLCANLAAEGPLVLQVDDAHWADGPSLRFVSYLARRLEGLPIALVVTWRSEDPGADQPALTQLLTEPDALVVRPTALGAEGVARVVADAWEGAAVDPAFADACQQVTRGNPFLLHELLVVVRGDGLEPTAESAARVRELGPRTVSRAVLLRLGAMADEAVRLARAAAVLGPEVDLRHAAAVAGLDRSAAEAGADALVAMQVMEGLHPLAFVHPIVRASILEDLGPAELAAAHRRAAAALREHGAEPERIAEHLLHAPPEGDAEVVAALRAAAVRARSQGATHSAARWLDRALREPPPDAERDGLLLELGLAQMSLGDHEQGVANLTASLERQTDPVARARCFPDLAWGLVGREGVPAAVALLEREIAAVEPVSHEVALKLEADLASMGAMSPPLIPRIAERLAPFEGVAGETSGERLVLASLAQLSWYRNDPVGSVATIARRAFRGGRLLEDTSIEDLPAYQAVYALVMADALDEAQEAVDRMVAAGRVQGSAIAFGASSGLRAWVRQRRGFVADAAADGAQSFATLAQLGPLEFQQAMSFVGVRATVEALVERGELDAAQQTLVDTGFDGDILDLVPLNRVLYARGVLRLAQGRADEGLADLRELGARDAAGGVVAPGEPWRTAAATALAAAGERDEARALLDEQLELARAAELGWAQGGALRALAGLADDPDERVALLTEAVALLEGSQARLAEAHAQADLGVALRAVDREDDARGPLQIALRLAGEADAPPLARRAHAELEASGARPRRLAASGVADLSPAERRVADMAAEGLTNKEIAEALFLTAKTVENHLGRIYVKLGIHSRGELTALLAVA